MLTNLQKLAICLTPGVAEMIKTKGSQEGNMPLFAVGKAMKSARDSLYAGAVVTGVALTGTILTTGVGQCACATVAVAGTVFSALAANGLRIAGSEFEKIVSPAKSQSAILQISNDRATSHN
jgi:hypothetical protein